MNKQSREQIEQFNAVLDDCVILRFITIDSGLQEAACTRLQTLASDCRNLKTEAVADGNEDFANLLLGFECVTDCLRLEIKMCLLLKEEKPDEAWNALIDAQTAATDAVKAHKGFSHLERQVERLEAMEALFFPRQTFLSSGLIVRRQQCSICGSEYGECEHLLAKPYWGKFCSIIINGIEGDHVAIVKKPADKGCRILRISVDDGERNCMTWKIEPKQHERNQAAIADTGAESTKDTSPTKPLRVVASLLRSL